jgi:hypothetical protein
MLSSGDSTQAAFRELEIEAGFRDKALYGPLMDEAMNGQFEILCVKH